MKSGSLLMDVASAKGDVVDRMKGLKQDIELVSLHPLFGPGARDIKNKIFVSVPVRAGERYLELKKIIEDLGGNVVEMGSEEHDRLMAITQCLTHFLLISYINTLNSMKYSKKARETPTPMSVALLELAKSILAGNPEVYGELQVSNRYAKMVRSKFMESCRGLDLALSAHDVKDVQKVFDEALTSWGKKETKEAYKRLYKKFEKVMKK
jgi:prephenate dehydrogenase